MADMPKHVVRVIRRHEWVISNNGDPLDAKQFYDGLRFAQLDMDAAGIELGHDDAFHVKAEDNEITLYVELEDSE